MRVCAAGATLLLASPSIAEPPSTSAVKWAPWVEFGGYYGSNDTSRGEAVLWVPFAQGSSSLLFGEARGKIFEDDMREGNFALGYRQMMPGGWNLGAWGGYDIRESAYGNTFHQITGGIEALSDRWDVRANAYFPVDDSKNIFGTTGIVTTGPALEFTGSTIGLVTTVTTTTSRLDEVALWGFDAEIGAKLFSTPEDLPGTRHELRVYAGAFHFDHSDLPDSVTGPRLRAEWRMDEIVDRWAGSRLTFEAEYSHDDLRDDRVEVGARLKLPFGESGTRVASRTLTAQERRMTEGLERDTDIVTNTKTTSTSSTSTSSEAVEDARTGVRFDRVASADATSDISTTSTAAGANSLIIATGSIDGAQELQGNQTLQGGGSTIQVRGVVSGTVLDFTAPGARPTLTNTADSAVLTVAGSNTHIAGVDVTGVGNAVFLVNNFGIYGNTNLANVHIDAVTVADTGSSGILFWLGSSVNISNSVITQPSAHGIFFFHDNTISISDTTIVGAGGSGMYIGSNNTLTMTDTDIRNSGLNGLLLDSGNSADVARLTIENTGGNGIVGVSGDNELTLNESHLAGTIGNVFSAGIRIGGANNTLGGTGNTVAPGTVFGGGGFCNIAGAATGSIAFDIGNCP